MEEITVKLSEQKEVSPGVFEFDIPPVNSDSVCINILRRMNTLGPPQATDKDAVADS